MSAQFRAAAMPRPHPRTAPLMPCPQEQAHGSGADTLRLCGESDLSLTPRCAASWLAHP